MEARDSSSTEGSQRLSDVEDTNDERINLGGFTPPYSNGGGAAMSSPASSPSTIPSPFSPSSSSSTSGKQGTFLHPGRPGRYPSHIGSSCSSYHHGIGSIFSSGRRVKPEANFLQKLRSRELTGAVRHSSEGTGSSRDPEVRFFSRLPGRLAFCLRDAIPFSAIEAGHIFLGFSKCGQFLLSYTQTEADIDLIDLIDPHLQYHYRLHWWLFVPYRRAKKVAEISLFNQVAGGNLHLSFCQWPQDMTKVLIFGYQMTDGELGVQSTVEDEHSYPSRPCYITVTAVPALNACKECSKVASSYEEDELAEAWNSCVRLSCLEHGMTVHTTFDLVPPYPNFEPKVSLKRDSGVVINSGNLLHFLNFELEDKPMKKPVVAKKRPASMYTSELRISVGEQPYFQTSSTSGGAVGGGGMFSPLHLSDRGDSDCESDASSCYSKHNRSRRRFRMNPERLERVAEFVSQLSSPPLNQPCPPLPPPPLPPPPPPPPPHRSGGATLTTQTSTTLPPPLPLQPGSQLRRVLVYTDSSGSEFRATSDHQVPASVASTGPSAEAAAGSSDNGACGSNDAKRKRLADQAYEINDDNFNEGINDKLSTFRKKRLADKKYEFTTEDELMLNTNVAPLRRSQTAATAAAAAATSMPCPEADLAAVPSCSKSSDNKKSDSPNSGLPPQPSHFERVPEFSNTAMLSPTHMMMSPTHHASLSGSLSHLPPPTAGQQNSSGKKEGPKCAEPQKFYAKFTRRYIELDDEMVSVISGIDVDDDGVDVGYQIGGGYHSALPLEVHGSGYKEMTLISNAKAEKLNKRCVKIQQNSLDVDWFCHEMAQKLCAVAGKTYWYCNDYDVEVVDFDPVAGDVICVAVVLVTATYVTQKVVVPASASTSMPCQISSLQRYLHQGTLKFCWNVDSGNCELIDSEPLKELYKQPHGNNWHPARNMALSLQKNWGVMGPNSGAGNIRCFTNESVIRGTSLKTIVDTDHLVAIILDDLE